MGRSKGRPATELGDRAFTRSRGDDGRRECISITERRQEPRDGPCQERLARARRSDEQQAMAAGQGDLEPAPCLDLATDLAQVRAGGRPDPGDAFGGRITF